MLSEIIASQFIAAFRRRAALKLHQAPALFALVRTHTWILLRANGTALKYRCSSPHHQGITENITMERYAVCNPFIFCEQQCTIKSLTAAFLMANCIHRTMIYNFSGL